jgi:hypothetical protein
MSVRRLVVPPLLLVATLLSACATDDGSASASPSEPDESAAQSGSQAASPSDSANGDPEPLPAGGEGPIPIPPARYVSETTGASVTFELTDDTWRGLEDLPDVGFALLREFGTLASLSVVAFDGEVFSDPCDPAAEPTTIDDGAAAFVDWLASVPGVEAQAPTETTVGGMPAVVMDLTTALPAECDEPPWIFLWVLPTVGDFHFGDAETVRVWAVDTEGGTVALVAEANEGVDTDAFLSAVDDILATMTIE